MEQLQARLSEMQDKSGVFNLVISCSRAKHAIYLSLEPPCFCDHNDRDFITTIPQIRKFATEKEMLEALYKNIIYSYPDWDRFSVLRYTQR
jgi:hypothetical protein